MRAGAQESPGRPRGVPVVAARPLRPPRGGVWACPRLPAGRILGGSRRKEERGRVGTREGKRLSEQQVAAKEVEQAAGRSEIKNFLGHA